MNFAVQCACGEKVYFPVEWAGTRRLCPYCDAELVVPGQAGRMPGQAGRTWNPLGLVRQKPGPPSSTDSPATSAAPAATAGTATAATAAPVAPQLAPLSPREAWAWRCLVLSVALIPLIVSLLSPPNKTEFVNRLRHTIEKLSPEEQREVNKTLALKQGERPDLDDMVMALPGHRIEGAHLPRDSWTHWLYAAAAALLFMLFIVLLLPSSSARPWPLFKVGLFTGTIGTVLLFAFQFAAAITQNMWVTGFGIVTIVFYIVKAIGYSYSAALDPDNGFLLSALGFTFGVGLCEEACKLLPALKRLDRFEPIDWRGLYLWGLVSGFGFGISEGIAYASGYNGIQTGGIYAVRFISCVALHGIWSGSAAITLFQSEQKEGFFRILAVPVVLHGLYDTLLKKNMDVLALVVAFASLGWMVFQIREMSRKDRPASDAQNDEQAFSHA
jgi:RsiW-degrading membrane proteinase PrsW (M82 family)